MPKFLTIHKETNVDRVLLESRWTEISMDPRAEWQMTLYGTDLGERYCEWEAPSRNAIEEICGELGIKYSEIIEVEVTSPSDWCLWRMESRRGMRSCWEVTNCGRQPKTHDAATSGFCPAAVGEVTRRMDGNRFSRRHCWKVVGTCCAETVHGTMPERIIESSTCPFFAPVAFEPGHSFQI